MSPALSAKREAAGAGDLRCRVRASLDAAEVALTALRPARGAIGHNEPPDLPLTEADGVEAAATTAALRREATSGAAPDATVVRSAVDQLDAVTLSIREWLVARGAGPAADEALDEAGLPAEVRILILAMQGREPDRLGPWLRAARDGPVAALRRFAERLRADGDAVRGGVAGVERRPDEGQINRLKTLKRQM
jgi:hypothetical protein